MADKQLVDYIKSSSKRGMTESQIRQALASSGWQKTQINEAFSATFGGPPAPLPPSPQTGNQAKGSVKFGFYVTLLAGVLIIIASLLAVLFPVSLEEAIRTYYTTGQTIPRGPDTMSIIVGFASGAIIVYGATQMRKSGREKTAAKLVLLFSVINLIIIGVGGIFGIGGSVLGMLGGILALMKK
jgi:hypothetical protein